ncbi:MAG: hypothetical protein KTR29_20430 [Rhodothermaceae bacterium]|nr:hypothetical protein [Rhodothermaceae bacterium]
MQDDVPVYINYGIGRFLPMLEQFAEFLKTVPLNTFTVQSNQAPVGIIVSPRNNSGIPFCNIAIALLYAARGYPVTIIWDDLEFLDPDGETQNRCVGILVEAISKHSTINFIQLSGLEEVALDTSDEAYLQEIALNNAVWNVRNIVPTEELDFYARLSFEAMCTNAGKIKHLYDAHTFDHCVHQSLLNNNGGVHKYFANQNGIRVSCLDASNGRGMIGLHDVQGYFYDVLPLIDPQSLFYLFKEEEYKEHAIEAARSDHEKRLYGHDERSTQPVDEESEQLDRYDIVIPLNIFWDTSALGRNRFFASPYEWLVETVSYILSNTSFSVVLRQHPHEVHFKKFNFETGTLLGRDLQSRFGSHPQFRFVSSEEKVNTYHLIQQADLVLPYTSTLGIEAAMMGKRVIVESNVYYADQPFVHKAESIEDYFTQIKNGAQPSVSETDKMNGWLLYYLVSQTPFVHTSFGLDPVDIQKWTTSGFDALSNDKALGTAIDCLASNTPYSFSNGKRLLEEAIAKKRLVHDTHLAYHT